MREQVGCGLLILGCRSIRNNKAIPIRFTFHIYHLLLQTALLVPEEMHILVPPTDILCPCPLDEKNGDRNDDEPVDLHNTNERLKVQGGAQQNHTQIQSFLVNKSPHGESSAFQRF